MKTQQFEVTVRRLRYEDKATGFTIAQVSAPPAQSLSSDVLKGYFPGISMRAGVRLLVDASLSKHKTYGSFWDVKGVSLPKSSGHQEVIEALTAYLPDLSAGKIRNVINMLPDDDGLWEEFRTDADALFAKHKITSPDCQSVLSSWKDYARVHASISQLKGAGIADRMILKVMDSLGENALEEIEENPYVLLRVEGMTFKAVDKYACDVRGLPLDSPLRVSELSFHMFLRVLREGGHVFYPFKDLRIKLMSGLEREGINNSFLSEAKLLSLVESWQDDFRVTLDDLNNVYQYDGYRAEQAIIAKLLRMQGQHKVSASTDVAQIIRDYEARNKISLSDLQREAVMKTATSKIFLLTGLPGTGKSTVMRAVVFLMRVLNRKVTLLAPTGIAAQRLCHTTGVDTSTIHRFLGYQGDDTWTYSADKPVSAETLILDEMSMVGANTFYRLLDAIPDDAQIILAGDPAQLPSVEEGNILQDLITSGVIDRVHLTQIFRQDSTSTIVTASHAIHAGIMPDLTAPKSEFAFSQHETLQEAQDRLISLAAHMYAKNQMGNKLSYQVIAPKYAGILGVDAINARIREAINPSSKLKVERQFGLLDLREGDRVICLKNNAQRGVYNGEIGKVEVIDPAQKEVLVKFFGYKDQEDKTVIFTFVDVSHYLRHAFAITTHRSQGQEWDVVIMALAREHGIMLQRQLLYTAVTRARKKVILVGEWQAISKSVNTEVVTKRFTRLAEILAQAA